jgi:hypothetical protein
MISVGQLRKGSSAMMIDPRSLQQLVEAEHRERLERLEQFRFASQYGTTTHPIYDFLMQAGAGLIERAKGLRSDAAASSMTADAVLTEAIKTSTGTFPAVS